VSERPPEALEHAREAHRLVEHVLAQPRPRTHAAYYGAVNLFAISELAEGVLSELVASRRNNAIRLVRHVWEFEVEMSWVLADPQQRIAHWRATEARRQRLTRENPDGVPDNPYDRMLADLDERAREEGTFIPSVQGMADSLGRSTQVSNRVPRA
jgi:hypothetical protein